MKPTNPHLLNIDPRCACLYAMKDHDCTLPIRLHERNSPPILEGVFLTLRDC
ncbi:MAG: hypothetical protein WC466_02445 [Candidatus Izemoplasmatales bacterium]